MNSPVLAEIQLAAGDMVRDKYKVAEKLGEGGFGAVYRVEDAKAKEEYALKLESKKEVDSMVKVEAIVLQKLAKRKLTKHACRYIDDGETPVFRYVVMQLLGRSLSDLRKSTPNKRFSLSTTIRLGIQSMEAIEALHQVGFLHRDIKPGNFAMGRKDAESRIVYMLDYGLCRQYIAPDGQIRPPRKVAGFRGTVRYASVNTHLRKELGRHDDFWSLYYMLIEMRTGELPWIKKADKDIVLKKKQETPVSELVKCFNEPEMVRMYEQLTKLTYFDQPNYVWFILQLRTIGIRNKFNDTDPFDWEPGGESYDACCKAQGPKSSKKKKKEKRSGAENSARMLEEKDGGQKGKQAMEPEAPKDPKPKGKSNSKSKSKGKDG